MKYTIKDQTMKNSAGQFQPKNNIQCQKCGRIVGPSYPQKMAYVQYGAGAGNFCSKSCTVSAYEEVVKAHPQLVEEYEPIFKVK